MKHGILCCLFLAWMPLFGQADVAGQASIRLQNGATDCNDQCDTVEVFVDVTGLSGTVNAAGLNAFVLAFDLSRADVFASARAGTTPVLDWAFTHTARATVDQSNRLVLVGSVAASDAPNGEYHVATLVFCGSAGNLNLSFVAAASSLGSRYIDGDGPGPIAFTTPVAFQTTLTVDFPLSFLTGVAAWRQAASAYDLVLPQGDLDILDLVKLTACGLP